MHMILGFYTRDSLETLLFNYMRIKLESRGQTCDKMSLSIFDMDDVTRNVSLFGAE
jgi:hypothetical protein